MSVFLEAAQDNLSARVEAALEPLPEGAVATRYSAIRPERVTWLWPGRVPVGMLTLLSGDPGLGKSTVSCHLAAEVSRRGGAVLLVTAEDSRGATVRPRLEAAGADLDLVHAVTLRREGVEEGLVLPDDVADLDSLVGSTSALLVVIDPLMAHLGGRVDSFKDKSVREALAPLHRLAEAHGVAVVVIVHLNKSPGGDPLHRIGGSIGIPGAARSALLLARDPEDPEGDLGQRRVLAHVKCNVAPLAPSLACRVEGVTLAEEDGTTTVRFVVDGESGLSGAELLARPPDAEERTERDEAAAFLLDELAGGPRPVRDVERAAKDAGIAEKTLRRAKGNLGIKSTKEGFGAGWTWALPEGGQPPVAAFADAQGDHLRESPVPTEDSTPSPTPIRAKGATSQRVAPFGDESELVSRVERLAARHADLAGDRSTA